MTSTRRGLSLGLTLVLFTALVAPAWAGTADVPEITDPTGDVTASDGGPLETVVNTATGTLCGGGAGAIPGVGDALCNGATPGSGADLTAAWAQETAGTLNLTIQAAGTLPAGALTQVVFGITTSGGTAAFNFTLNGTTPEGNFPAGATAATSGNFTWLEIPLQSLGAEGGGTLTGWYLERSATEAAILAAIDPALADGTVSGDRVFSDRAPDTGAGSDFIVVGQAPPCDVDGFTDADCDGLPDVWESDNIGNLAQSGSDDADNDGCNNLCEYQAGSDPTNADTDGDGLTDGEEADLGTDPTNADTDGDGVSDGDEVAAGTDPTAAEGDPDDTDADGLPDTWEQDHFGNLDQTASGDPDADGLNNTQEFDAGTDPNAADTDGDGVSDGDEVNTYHTDPTDSDSDNDGTNDGDEIAAGTDPLVADAAPTTEDDPVQLLKDNVGYLAIAGGALLGVLLLSIIALAGRWKK